MLLKRLLRAVKDVVQAIQDQTESIHAAKEEQNRQYRTKNSIRLATWSAVIAVLAALAAWFQAYQAREANQIAHDALVANQRPWIGVSGIIVDDDLTYTNGGTEANFKLGYVLKNVGHSPAFVKIYGRILDAGDHVKNERQSFCDARKAEVKRSEDGLPTSSFTAIPELPMTYYIPYTNEPSGTGEWAAQPLVIHMQAVIDGYFQPYNVGCIFYQSITDKEVHEILFYGEITTVGPDGNPPAAYQSKGISLKEGNIQRKKLCVVNVLSTQSPN
jgi:hypothetical protein